MLHYWRTIEKAKGLVDDPRSKYSTLATEKLTAEEMDGVMDVERIARFLTMPAKDLRKDLKHLTKVLDV